MKTFLFILNAFLVHSKVVELTNDNWNNIVTESEKHIFVKFFAPWCGHCKKLKPDWDKLGDSIKSQNIMIGTVDCTAEEGKELCETNGIKGFPTLKSFWKNSAEDYEGGREYSELKAYAENLKPPCTLESTHYCTDDQLEYISQMKQLRKTVIKEKIKKMESEVSESEKDLQDLLQRLQSEFGKEKTLHEQRSKQINVEKRLAEMVYNQADEKDEV
jgi:protein disulfide-isomerase-like protein